MYIDFSLWSSVDDSTLEDVLSNREIKAVLKAEINNPVDSRAVVVLAPAALQDIFDGDILESFPNEVRLGYVSRRDTNQYELFHYILNNGGSVDAHLLLVGYDDDFITTLKIDDHILSADAVSCVRVPKLSDVEQDWGGIDDYEDPSIPF
jgi:hypothetical protein